MLQYPDRVRVHTALHVNQKIDHDITASVQRHAGMSKADISDRVRELDREWDIERIIEINAPTVALAGLALGIVHDRRWLALPATVMSLLLWHGIKGWCPPIPVLRRMGVRTRREIDMEKYALKALRGDFDELPKFNNDSALPRAEAALIATQL